MKFKKNDFLKKNLKEMKKIFVEILLKLPKKI
jgi:hypothetical protein